MKKTGYILFILWLSTVVVSNALMIRNSFFDTSSIEFAEKESKEKSTDDSDENEKKSDEKNKSEKELFSYKNLHLESAEMIAESRAKSQIKSGDEDCISSLYVFLPENPPKL